MTIRVFISSTFRDMHAERDYLSRQVFPELRSRCQKRGAEERLLQPRSRTITK